MNQKYTKTERAHLERVKLMGCIVCGAPPVSEAHHIKQDSAYYCVPLCQSCHRDIHGMKNIWRVYKLDEIDALALTIKNISK